MIVWVPEHKPVIILLFLSSTIPCLILQDLAKYSFVKSTAFFLTEILFWFYNEINKCSGSGFETFWDIFIIIEVKIIIYSYIKISKKYYK